MTAHVLLAVLGCLGGLICGAAAGALSDQRRPVAAVLMFVLGMVLTWCGVQAL